MFVFRVRDDLTCQDGIFVRFVLASRHAQADDERRQARQEQVLDAARACLQEHGLEAVSMEMIIARSGLSTGAVYGYFKGKDQIINAVVAEGTAAMADDLAPVLLPLSHRHSPSWLDRCSELLSALAGTRRMTSTGCSSPYMAGVTPRAIRNLRRPHESPMPACENYSLTQRSDGRLAGHLIRGRILKQLQSC